MKIEREMIGDVGMVTLRGEFDTFYVNEFASEVESFAGRGVSSLILNMRFVRFINSTAVGAVIRARRRFRDLGGELAIVEPSKAVADVLQTLGLHKVMPICKSFDEALDRLGRSEEGVPLEEGNSVLFRFADGEKAKAFGRPLGVGRIVSIDPDHLHFRWTPPRKDRSNWAISLFEPGTVLNLKFRLPLFKKEHYFEFPAKVESRTLEPAKSLRVAVYFDDLSVDYKRSIEDFVKDMTLLRDQARGGGRETGA
jgi:anti-anti-sigma factor